MRASVSRSGLAFVFLRRLVSVLYLACLVLGATSVSANAPGESADLHCATIDIDRAGAESLAELESALSLWLEMDDLLFACGSESDFAPFASRTHTSWNRLDPADLFIVRVAHPGRTGGLDDVSVLAQGGSFSVVQATTPAVREDLRRGLWLDHAAEDAAGHDGCKLPKIAPFVESRVLARQSANDFRRAERGAVVFGPEVAEAVAAVDFDRWFSAAETLAGWNRYTHGGQIDDASAWLVSQFSALGLAVETPIFEVSGTAANNVIATWTGTTRPDDWFVVGGHYDSISQNPFVSAPGAEDNASGCAGVLELARVLVPRLPDATIIFVCYSGEEQGLFGSEDHASGIVADGDAKKLLEVQTMDMIGYTGDSDLDILLETEPEFASILDIYVDAASAFTSLRTVVSLNAFGSDHVPFLNRNLPALLTIENDWASYPGYHSTSDLPSNLDLQMGGQTLQMNVAVLAHRAGLAGLGDIFGDGFESGSTSQWSATVP